MTEFSTDEQVLPVRDLGRMVYAAALELQRTVNQQVIDGQPGVLPPDVKYASPQASGQSGVMSREIKHASPQAILGAGVGVLLLVEHEPVITVTHRPGVSDHLLADSDKLKELGIELCLTDRGGDITYHGPGQLVAYPILNLNRLKLNLGRYMRLLEQIVIDTVAAFGIEAMRVDGCTGVWARSGIGYRVSGIGLESSLANHSDVSLPETRSPIPDTRHAKLCALGVRVRRGVSMHGLALNVSTDLSHFETIVPCGLANRSVTSMAELLGERVPSMDQVKEELIAQFRKQLNRRDAENAEQDRNKKPQITQMTQIDDSSSAQSV
ncbi:MAG: lipoyl(octanoyl) transferase [Phycisphaeraceae bacterium]|nr:lipoyl(octanoyl) transferase [Phycisphaeraceae bacterium]